MNRFSSFLAAACLCLLGAATLLPATQALAQSGTPPAAAAAPTQLENPLGQTTTINQFVGKVINAVLGLSGAAALVMFVWGGVQWLISGGSADKIKQAKNTLVSAAIGIVILFTSYTLVNAIIQALASGTVQ